MQLIRVDSFNTAIWDPCDLNYIPYDLSWSANTTSSTFFTFSAVRDVDGCLSRCATYVDVPPGLNSWIHRTTAEHGGAESSMCVCFHYVQASLCTHFSSRWYLISANPFFSILMSSFWLLVNRGICI